ncbi:Uncharacterised protein [BD1-7 clade bacterium]|uniref:Uncharacterized protein n=1 Tax=BD1-7 clade bacterium TaxID=2029982 RepID=A0A5S9P7T3_9GAMM|nr:Uncharacterised protein [BD1-7 clade bacterium]CAA0099710.1 Uncharacterised protein [BD1-7 clade bacterium]
MNMNPFKISIIFVLSSTLLQSGCSSEKAHAESPCPSRIYGASLTVLDSISREVVSTSSVYLSGRSSNNNGEIVETQIIYNSDAEIYRHDSVFGDSRLNLSKSQEIFIYVTDSNYNSNVSVAYNYGCTDIEQTIYLCPNGTACR